MNGRSKSKTEKNAETFEDSLEKMIEGFAEDAQMKKDILTHIGLSLGLDEFHEESKILSKPFFISGNLHFSSD